MLWDSRSYLNLLFQQVVLCLGLVCRSWPIFFVVWLDWQLNFQSLCTIFWSDLAYLVLQELPLVPCGAASGEQRGCPCQGPLMSLGRGRESMDHCDEERFQSQATCCTEQSLSCQCQPSTWCLLAREESQGLAKEENTSFSCLLLVGLLINPPPRPASTVRITCVVRRPTIWSGEEMIPPGLPCGARLRVWKCQAWVAFFRWVVRHPAAVLFL